jgi:hypothetical protein
MSDVRTAEEVRAAKHTAMPNQLGELHYLLAHDLTVLHFKWRTFIELYCTSEERIELLNATAHHFFSDLQGILWEDVLLHINRLTQKATTFGHENLTIEQLLTHVSDDALKGRLKVLIEAAKAKCDFAQDWRNRHIAHRNLPPLDGRTPEPLASATRQNVEDALAAVRATMNAVESHYEHATTHYPGIESPYGAGALIMFLQKGFEAMQREEKAFRNRNSPDVV